MYWPEWPDTASYRAGSAAHRGAEAAALGSRRGAPEPVDRSSRPRSDRLGHARSAPGVMLAIQALAIAALLRGPSPRARRTLGVLGGIMTLGYLAERNPSRVPGRLDPVETPVYGAGLLGAVLMAWLGLQRTWPSRSPHGSRITSESTPHGQQWAVPAVA